jgi:hypothetical protein
MVPILVVFHMRGCPHCPSALAACEKLQSANVLAVEDAHPMVTELGINSFPTIWLSLPDGLFEYRKPQRTSQDIEAWIQQKMHA